MKYVALLRGINVGGSSVIKMTALKEAAEHCGFGNVKTFIQSGNIVFDSNEEDTGKLAARLENCLLRELRVDSSVIILNREQLNKVLSEVPDEWKENNLRCYIAFIKEPVTSEDVKREIEPRAGVDFVKTGKGVLYLSTLLSGITKSGFSKLAAKRVYKGITIRNYTTSRKLIEYMEHE
jgi:uncharacterized protein (DUF1697 family)